MNNKSKITFLAMAGIITAFSTAKAEFDGYDLKIISKNLAKIDKAYSKCLPDEWNAALAQKITIFHLDGQQLEAFGSTTGAFFPESRSIGLNDRHSINTLAHELLHAMGFSHKTPAESDIFRKILFDCGFAPE